MGRKWNNIKEKKGAQDKARGQIYTKLLREVTKAVKNGGESPESNFMLRLSLEKCRKHNVPKDNVDRAIKKGLGGDDDGYSDVNYEGYGLGGVGIFIEASTNNPTRTAANVRNCFTKCGGSLGTTGCLQFIFDHKAVFEIPADQVSDEESFSLELIDSGAEDIVQEDGHFIVTGPMTSFGSMQKKVDELGLKPEEAGLERVPTTFKEVDKETFESIMKLTSLLEADDDVNKVYHNIQYSDAFLED